MTASGGAANDVDSPFADRGSRTLVIQTAFLGDVILTTPLLEVLAARHGPVDVVTTPGAAQLLETHPAVRTVLRHDKHGSERGLGGILRLAHRLRANGYARAYLPHKSWRTGVAARLARIPERIGFADAPARSTYTARVAPSGTHEVDRLLALAGAPPGGMPSLGLTDADHGIAMAWLETTGVPSRFVVMAPGSIWGTKRWGQFPALAQVTDAFVVVIGGPEDRALGEAIVAAAPGRSANACGAMPLRASAALLSRAAALITNDSAPLHLAQATATPTVALFGPTVPGFGFGPRGASDQIEEVSGLACRPCSRHGPARCPLGHHRCMTDLEVDRVAMALRHVLSTPA
jgi:heptosyltransferase-2